jgi:hypothetical protein
MKLWNTAVAFMLGIGLTLAPLAALADHHEKAESSKEKKMQGEGNGGHAHDGAKKEEKADMKKAGASEEGSAAGHAHEEQGEEKEGSH